jgi:hypothetical protein
MPIERRIREGAERNAGVLDPDVDRFLDSVVHKTHRRQIVRRSLSAAAAVAALVLVIIVGPSVLDGVGGSGGTVPGSEPTTSVAPSATPVVPLLTGMFTRSIPEGTAVVRANGIAGTWTISAEANGRVRLLAPASFAGAHASHRFEMQTGSLATDTFSSGICAGLPAGTYRWSVQAGFLVLTAISDQCDARVVVLGAGPWAIRS